MESQEAALEGVEAEIVEVREEALGAVLEEVLVVALVVALAEAVSISHRGLSQVMEIIQKTTIMGKRNEIKNSETRKDQSSIKSVMGKKEKKEQVALEAEALMVASGDEAQIEAVEEEAQIEAVEEEAQIEAVEEEARIEVLGEEVAARADIKVAPANLLLLILKTVTFKLSNKTRQKAP